MTERVPEERPPLERVPLTPRERMAIDRHGMPERDATARSHDFAEVNLGYTDLLAIAEAERCLQCKNPKCIEGCPVRVNIPRFIDLLAKGDIHRRGRIAPRRQRPALRHRPGLPPGDPVRGPLPPGQEGQAGRHRLPRALRRRLGPGPPRGDDPRRPTVAGGKRVAIVGSGPAGLTAAGELVKLGYDVTIFEAFHAAGGVLVYGIPEFRLPKDIVQREVDRLVADGVKIEKNQIIGKTFTLPELRDGSTPSSSPSAPVCRCS